MDILDNPAVVAQRDPENALQVAADEYKQLGFDLTIENTPSNTNDITSVIVTGMGGSALAAGMAKDWLDLDVPFEVVKGYTLPRYVGGNTLVIASSYSGNTEEALSALAAAQKAGAVCAVIASGGALLDIARESTLPFVQLPGDFQPRMGVLANLNALVRLLAAHGVLVETVIDELTRQTDWLRDESATWTQAVSGESNIAKQLALKSVGKTPVIYAGSPFRSVGYKWKISFNENAKNTAFCNEVPEFNHNEFLGWTSHPVEKPFAVIDLRSALDHPQIQKRFEVSDRLLSGQRPAALPVQLRGETVLQQMLWGSVLADFVSIYLAILNGVDPTKVELIEKLKKELS